MGCSSSVAINRLSVPVAPSQRGSKDVLGVSLEYLQDFVKKIGCQLLGGLTCHDVCDAMIKPMTLRTAYGATTGQSVARSLHAAFDTRAGDVQAANWYVVHPWSGLFLELVAALEMFFSDARNRCVAAPVLWIDLFCVNQHSSDRSCGELIQAEVLPALTACGRAIFVPGVWKRTATFRRTWCLFELSRAHAGSLPVFLALAPSQRIIFLRFIEELSSHRDFYDAMGRIELSQSACSHPDDHDWLQEDLSQTPGAAALEHAITSVLRGWLLLQLQQQLASSLTANHGAPDVAKWMLLIGELLADSGETSAAVAMYQDALQRLQGCFGPQHARVISCSWALSKLLVKLERYDESVPLLTNCFETKKAILGASNDSVLTVQHTLASVLTTIRE